MPGDIPKLKSDIKAISEELKTYDGVAPKDQPAAIEFNADKLSQAISEYVTSVLTGGTLVTMGEGEKKTGVDAGTIGQMSITDDYLYICVLSGEIGIAIWKKSVLFAT